MDRRSGVTIENGPSSFGQKIPEIKHREEKDERKNKKQLTVVEYVCNRARKSLSKKEGNKNGDIIRSGKGIARDWCRFTRS